MPAGLNPTAAGAEARCAGGGAWGTAGWLGRGCECDVALMSAKRPSSLMTLVPLSFACTSGPSNREQLYCIAALCGTCLLVQFFGSTDNDSSTPGIMSFAFCLGASAIRGLRWSFHSRVWLAPLLNGRSSSAW